MYIEDDHDKGGVLRWRKEDCTTKALIEEKRANVLI